MKQINKWMVFWYFGIAAMMLVAYYLVDSLEIWMVLAAAFIAQLGITTHIQNRLDALNEELRANGLIAPEKPDPVRRWLKRLYSRG